MIVGSKAKIDKLEALLARVVSNTERRPVPPRPSDEPVITALVREEPAAAKAREIPAKPTHAVVDQVTTVEPDLPPETHAAMTVRGAIAHDEAPAPTVDDLVGGSGEEGVLEILGEADATIGDDTLEIIATGDATDAIDELVVVTGESEFEGAAIDLPQEQGEFAPSEIATPPPPRMPSGMSMDTLDDLTMELPLEPDFTAPKPVEQAVAAPLEIQHVSMPIAPAPPSGVSIPLAKEKPAVADLTIEMPPETREAPALELTREAPAFEPTREARAMELPLEMQLPDDKTLAEPEISLETATPSLEDEPAPESGPQLVAAPAQSDRMPVAAPASDLSTARMAVAELSASAKPAAPITAIKPEPVVIAPDVAPKGVVEFIGATKEFHPETIAALIDAALNL